MATLFAAIMNTLDGTVLSVCENRHRHQEWLKFLRVIDRVTPPRKELHLIVDNHATHQHPDVQRWLDRHRRFHIHFTPTSSSWLNMAERFFRDLTRRSPSSCRHHPYKPDHMLSPPADNSHNGWATARA
jgi:hypothetical protein